MSPSNPKFGPKLGTIDAMTWHLFAKFCRPLYRRYLELSVEISRDLLMRISIPSSGSLLGYCNKFHVFLIALIGRLSSYLHSC
jgi:hypothetical protein